MNSQPCNKKQLAAEMFIGVKKLNNILKAKDIYVPRGLISPILKQEILEKAGWIERARKGAN
jgi:hypothetical protein